MIIKLVVNGTSIEATLFDNPSSRDFFSMLPLDLQMEDYVSKEKIGYLPRKLTTEGSAPFDDEAAGDIAYYAPWGNLAIFYSSYRYSHGLTRLGRLDGPITPLLIDGSFSIAIEPVSDK